MIKNSRRRVTNLLLLLSKVEINSARHASTSAAFARGVDIQKIKKPAGWSENFLVFPKHYRKEIVNDNESFALVSLPKD